MTNPKLEKIFNDLRDRYIKAYLVCNRKIAPPMAFEKGWVIFDEVTKLRLKTLLKMVDVLEKRAN